MIQGRFEPLIQKISDLKVGQRGRIRNKILKDGREKKKDESKGESYRERK